MNLRLKPIGFVKSPVLEGRDDDWGRVVSEIYIDSELAAGLDGLEAFSHLQVLFWMHLASFDAAADLRRRPRGRQDLPNVGIFAQRAKHRPNPIGLTSVRLLERKGSVVKVQGLDAIDGSPVLDLKPYFPEFDRIANPTVAEWVPRLMQGYF